MNVIECDSSHTETWNAYVSGNPSASFYHRFEWRDVNATCFGHPSVYLAAVEGSRIVGILPLVQVKSLLFGNIACSLPFVNYGGPACDNDDIQDVLLKEAAAVAERWRVDYVEIRSQRHLGEAYPCSQHKVSMTVDLKSDPDALWTAFKGDHRKDIKRGYKYGFTAEFGGVGLLDPFYDVLSESWRALGTPIYQREYLKTVLTTFPQSTRICVIRAADGVPAAAAFYGEQRGTAEGMWLGMRDQYRTQLVGYVLYWELLKDACERGWSRFHLGRSTAQSNAEQFKKKWNAYVTQLYWQYLLRTRTDIPQLNVNNSKYKLAIAAWRKLPIGVTQQIGPMIARSIP